MVPIATTVAGLEPDTAANSRAGEHARHGKAPVEVADQRRGETDHAPRHSAVGEKGSGEDEKRIAMMAN